MKITNNILLIIIVAVGALLRFWNYADIPYSHDEFSALFRTDFTTFSELIEHGVRPDGHPAGIQVFLYYWTGLFGNAEWIVKLPFTLMGLLSIILMFLIGKKWFNETVGLIAAAFLSSLQYTIIYSVTARPYISGMFFALAMVWYWSSLVRHSEKWHWGKATLFVLFASLCAYNHHFSLLFAFIVGLTGLVMVPKKFRLQYFFTGLGVLILYLPHISIFLHQLGNKGVEGWLAKPENDWLWTYIRYSFHFSWELLVVVVILLLVGLRFRSLHISNYKYVGMFGVWFLVPFIIGFWYSKQVSAVLQYSVLIFSFPYLFLLIFGHFRELKPKWNAVIVAVILIACAATLSIKRKHFEYFYNSYYEHIILDAATASSSGTSLLLIDSHRKISDYYLKKNHLTLPLVWLDSFDSEIEFRTFIKKQSHQFNEVYLGAWASLNPTYLSIVEEYYPFIKSQENYYGGSTSVYSSLDGESISTVVSILDFTEDSHPHWENINEDKIVKDVRPMYLLDSANEWSPVFHKNISDMISHPNDEMVVSVRIKPIQSVENISLVMVVEEEGKVLHWSNVLFDRFVKDSTNDWHIVHQAIGLANIPVGDSAVFKAFIWNEGLGTYLLDDYEVKYRVGNPVIYGLISEH